jgi:ribosomal protein S18 acetylase RimI-like enzyme
MADIALVRRLLRTDPVWSLYALGDLDPRRAKFCDWYVRGPSVALLYREFGTPILFAAGAPDVLAGVPDLDACLLQVPEAFLNHLQERLDLDWTCPVLRMALDPARFSKPEVRIPVEPLDAADEPALRELYADGRESGEEPDFFMASQLGDGTFFGVREDGRLVAAGGTHLYAAAESVGAIGNVYTRRSHRGRGHAATVVAAIVERLIERDTETIGLNVRAANAGAIRLYERLGFTVHSRFWEGRAIKRTGFRL